MLHWQIKHNQVTVVHSGYDEAGELRVRLVQEHSRKATNLKLYCPPERLVHTLDHDDVRLAKAIAEEYLANRHIRRGG